MKKLMTLPPLLALLGALYLFGASGLGGGFTQVIVYGVSMQPTMYTGDLALVQRRSRYAVGDIVAYRVESNEGLNVPQGGIVIHRIIGGTAQDGFVMQGDNNSFIDPWRPTPDTIVGRAWLYVPRLGAVFSYLQDPLRLSIAVGGFFVYISLAGSILAHKGRGSRERRRLRRLRTSEGRTGSIPGLPW